MFVFTFFAEINFSLFAAQSLVIFMLFRKAPMNTGVHLVLHDEKNFLDAAGNTGR